MSLQRVRSSVWDTSDNLVVDRMDQLADVDREGICFVSGEKRPNDGGGGWFRYNAQWARNAADGYDVIDPTGKGVGNGCWVRQHFFSAPPGVSFSEVITATAGQTVVPVSRFSFQPGQGEISVYVNGTRLTHNSYQETSTTEITVDGPLRAGDVVEIVKYEVGAGTPVTALEASQVSFDDTNTQFGTADVQLSIEHLADLVGHATGGGPINAGTISIVPKDSNQNTLLQPFVYYIMDQLEGHLTGQPGPAGASTKHSADSIEYDQTISTLGSNVQQALDTLYSRLGHGVAKDIGFDPKDTPNLNNPLNVQALGKQLYDLVEVYHAEFVGHKNRVANAHPAAAISFDNSGFSESWFQNDVNVESALMTLAQRFATSIAYADQVQIRKTPGDAVEAQLAANVQEELKSSYQRLEDHKSSALAHPADRISFRGTQGYVSGARDNVQDAVTDIDQAVTQHFLGTAHEHQAKDIVFPSGTYGIQGSTVQDALDYINQGNWRYKGHLRLDQPVPAARSTNAVNEFWTVPVEDPQVGYTIDQTWRLAFHKDGQPPTGQITTDSYVFADENGALWWMAMNNLQLQDAIKARPNAGQPQSITSGAPDDAALTLLPDPGQAAPLLHVFGDVSVHDSDVYVRQGKVFDQTGNLRQTADGVAMNPIVPMQRNAKDTVQQYLLNLDQDISEHVSGTGKMHKAVSIDFSPIAGVPNNNVQDAIENVYNVFHTHETSNQSGVAHHAIAIRFDNTQSNNLQNVDVQNVLIELETKIDSGLQNIQVSSDQVTFDPTGGEKLTGTDVYTALFDLDAALKDHSDNGNHKADHVVMPNGNSVETELNALGGALTQHVQGVAGAGMHPATSISVAAQGGISAGDVQTALQEIDSRIATLSGGANSMNGGTF